MGNGISTVDTLPELAGKAVGRLAPSPTGALHLGNARSFLLAWLSIRQQNGIVLLRIEDIDSPRVKPWAVQSTIDDLKWLGLDWDFGPDSASAERTCPSRFSVPLVQTQRMSRYHRALETLRHDGAIYPCTCSRSEVANAASAPHEQELLDGPIYPGTCRTRKYQVDQLQDGFSWRWAFSNNPITWCDERLGTQTISPLKQLGDFVVGRSDNTPAYQLAVVLDDSDMGVTEVARGDDLIYSTYRQQAIIDHLDLNTPHYVHLPLVIGPDGRRLAKRHGDTRISFFRELSIAPETLIGYLAWTANLIAKPKRTTASELIGKLDWNSLPSGPTVLDQKSVLSELKRIN